MKTKMKHVKGRLEPSQMYAVTENTRSCINKALITHGLNEIIKKGRWENGIIDINSVTMASEFPANDVLHLISALHDLIKEDNLLELRLEGTLILTIETNDITPIIVRINVEHGQISYQEATLDWADQKPYRS